MHTPIASTTWFFNKYVKKHTQGKDILFNKWCQENGHPHVEERGQIPISDPVQKSTEIIHKPKTLEVLEENKANYFKMQAQAQAGMLWNGLAKNRKNQQIGLHEVQKDLPSKRTNQHKQTLPQNGRKLPLTILLKED